MIKTVFFDMGGVICVEGFRSGIRRYEIEHNITEGQFYQVVHDHAGWKDFTLGFITESEYLKICAQHAGSLPFDPKRYIELVDKSVEPNYEIIEYIKELAKKVSVGIISNHPKEWYERFSQRVGLVDVLKFEVVSGFVHLRKPSEEIFLKALQLAKVQPPEAVYIDDRQDILDGIKIQGLNLLCFDGNVKKLKDHLNIILNF